MISRKQFFSDKTISKTEMIENFLKKNKNVGFTWKEIHKAMTKKIKNFSLHTIMFVLQKLKREKKILHKTPYFIYK